MPLGS